MKSLRLAILNQTGGGISGGHRKYLLNMLPRFAASARIESILCSSPASLQAETWLPASPKITYVPCRPFIPLRHSPDAELSSRLKDFAPDLLFIPIERYVRYKSLPVVVMLQNMAPLVGAKTGYGIRESLVSMARKYETTVALRNAISVIVPTSYVKSYLVANGLADAGKIFSISYGDTPVVSRGTTPPQSHSLNKGFVFTAGSMEAYRGVEDLLKAFPEIKTLSPGIKLVIAGGTRPATTGYFEYLRALSSKLGLTEDIVWLGSVSEDELSWYYSNCSVFAITSRVESFCFVALEALAHGCNVVSSESACLPEVLGDAAIFYTAGDIPGLSRSISSVLARTSVVRAGFSNVARRRASAFSWDKTAADTISVFDSAVGLEDLKK